MYRILKLKFGGLLMIFIALILSITVASVPPKAEAGSSHYYYYFKEKQALGVDTNRIAVLERTKVRATNRFEAFGIADEDVEAHALEGWSLTKVPAGVRTVEEVSQLVGQMSAAEAADFISPVFTDAKGGPVIIVPDILMRFNEGVSSEEAEAILTEADVGTIAEKDWAGMSGAYRIRTTSRDGFEVLAAANWLAEREEVRYASPDMIVTGQTEYIPSDPLFPDCWGLHNTGQEGGTVDMDMDGPEAWDITTGDPSVIVVILDCGVEQSHPDIHQRPGYDFTGAGGGGGPVNSYDNHGTAVAGCVSAMINGLGVVGIAPNCKIASARVHTTTSSSGSFSFYISHVVNGIEWAVTIGARITNNSNSYDGFYSAITNKYQDTYQNHEIIHFAAAGNYSSSSITYPANLSSVNAVAAIDRDGSLASFSNYGNGLAFSAPGVEINTTDRTGSSGYDPGDYHVGNGTSYASPYAAGVAAILLSIWPSLSAEGVEQIMQDNCFDLGTAGYDTTFGWGLVNAYFSVDVKPLTPHTKWSQPPVEVDPNSYIPIYCGWDEQSHNVVDPPTPLMKIVADDFRCIGTMPVTSIHWWGSYVGWEGLKPPEPAPTSWQIAFWSNVPAGVNAPYSYPEKPLWQIDIPYERVDVNIVAQDYLPEIPYPDNCFQYNVELEHDEIFWQNEFIDDTNDNIFWISVAAEYNNVVPSYPWGWKTRPWSWTDDAVTFVVDEPNENTVLDPNSITPLEYEGESYDVCFELDTDPNWIKWEQLYTGIRNWPHYEDEKSMFNLPYPEEERLVVDDWPCDSNGAVSAIVWWGSYIGYGYEACQGPVTNMPVPPDRFQLKIWTDVPAGGEVTVAAGSDNGYVYVYDGAGNLLWNYDTGTNVVSVDVSDDGHYIAVGSYQNKLYLFNKAGTKLWEKSLNISSSGGGSQGTESKTVAISADGGYVVAACSDGLYVYNNDGTSHWSHPERETCVDISPDGNYIAACDFVSGVVRFFSIANSTPSWTIDLPNAFWVATSNPGYVSFCTKDGQATYLYNNAGTRIWTHIRKYGYGRVDMAEDGLSLVAVNDDPYDLTGCALYYFNHLHDGTPGWQKYTADETPVWTFDPGGGGSDFYSVAISGDGEYIATGPAGGSYVFSKSSSTPLQTFSMGSANAYDLIYGGQYGVCGNRGGKLYFFSKDSSTPLWNKTLGGVVHTVSVGGSGAYPYSHPGEVIWECETEEYDEVLVGYDKYPHGEPNEPVFRYSVRIPDEEQFQQDTAEGVYWLSVQAVYDVNTPNYDWGWTNHEHVFNDNAVSGYYDDVNEVWGWEELYDQTEASEDMSFMLFTEPDCISRTAAEYNNWIYWNKPACWCYQRQCRGDADGLKLGPFWVSGNDLTALRNCIGKLEPAMPPGCECCDFDHSKLGPFWVSGNDLAILRQYIGKLEALVPICDQPPIYTGPYNFWTN